MTTEWKYRVYVITKNKALGQALAELAAAYPSDQNAEADTFTDQYQTSPQGWAVVIPARQDFVEIVDALNEDVSVNDPRLDELRSRGLTTETWAQAKQNLIIDWIQVWGDDGSYTTPPSLAVFCAANDHALIVAPVDPDA